VIALPAVLCLAFLIVLLANPGSAVGGIAKTAASASFVAFGLASGLLDAGVVGVLGLAGLVLGAIGDVALLSREKGPFLAGIGVAPVFVAVAMLPLAGAGFRVWRWVGPRVGSLRPAVLAYVAIISAMVATAVGATGALPSEERAALLCAAVLFYLSDLFVARERFVTSDAVNRRLGLPLYYFAQLGFAGLLGSA
jgi:uncharacterized membrane protein YhhN